MDDNATQEYVDPDGDRIGEVVETAGNGKIGQNINRAGDDLMTTLKDWAERTEEAENRSFDRRVRTDRVRL